MSFLLPEIVLHAGQTDRDRENKVINSKLESGMAVQMHQRWIATCLLIYFAAFCFCSCAQLRACQISEGFDWFQQDGSPGRKSVGFNFASRCAHVSAEHLYLPRGL